MDAPEKSKAPAPWASLPGIPPEVAARSLSAKVGNYVRVQKIGQGSMGDVFKAWDLVHSRWAALKIFKSADPTQLARFLRESQLASQLTHPNITAVYDAGKDADKGKWWIAMQLVRGHTLKTFPRTNRRVLARLMAEASRALDYAHKHGIIHRDIKPENMMVYSKPKDGAGEAVTVDNCEHHLYLMDFGIARPTESSVQLTMAGTVMGTPAYMSPEQALGKAVDLRADVYSIGATLYDLLAGRPLVQEQNTIEAIHLIMQGNFPSPHKLDPTLSPALSDIVMKAIATDPEKRYQTAGGLADDLEAWLEGKLEPPPAAPKPAGGGFLAWVRRLFGR